MLTPKEGRPLHIHLIQPGDTLDSIASRYRVTPGVLSSCNDLPPAPFLLPGSALVIPSELHVEGTDGYLTYQAQEGDTPRSLAERWQIPLSWLSFCNSWFDASLRAGDVVLLPKTLSREKPALGLMSVDPLPLPGGGTVPLTYRMVPGLRIDAAGRLTLPPSPPEDDETSVKRILIGTLDGAANILPDVGKAILRSESTQARILDALASQVKAAGGDGVLFAWQGLRGESEAAYLRFVREAARRLHPMGLSVGLHLSGGSPLLKRTAELAETAAMLDHVVYEPAASASSAPADYYKSPPPPLFGDEDWRQALTQAGEVLPPAKLWAVLRPAAVAVRRGRVLQTLSPHAALQNAYSWGSPLQRDASGLLWFRSVCGEGGCSVWMEDLRSLLCKLDDLNELGWQGLALWEAGGYLPEAWTYLADMYTVHPDKSRE